MRHASIVALLVAASACGESHEGEEQLGPIAFEVPPYWQRTDSHGRNTATAVFAPAVNSRRETITVIRTELGPIAAKYSPAFLSRQLSRAQSSIAKARVTPVAQLTTARGFSGARIEAEFVPPGRTERYHRVHVLISDGGTALIHVLYTAASPDAELAAFQLVVDSLHEES